MPQPAPPPPFLGVLILDTRFPRPPGDVGNAETWRRHGIAVRFHVVAGASARRVVQEADAALLQPFIAAARQLADEGAAMIATSCGFLARDQAAIAQAVTVPVVTSSLLQCAEFARPGIVTFDADSLETTVLRGAGVAEGTPVEGLAPGCEMQRRILGNEPEMDLPQAERDVVDAALRLVRRHPEIEDIVLECTNMPPYRDAVARATGCRVHDLETLLVARWRATGTR